ncbi:MAG: NAD-dependent epimerase/dehydratase family protein [Flagellimonas sp.]
MTSTKILVTGAAGQLGKVLCEELVKRYGSCNIIATDLNVEGALGIKEVLDVTDTNKLEALVSKYRINEIYHLAAVLSAKGEAKPLQTWDVNLAGWLNVLEVSRKYGVKKIFFPSSIAVFGPSINKVNTPQESFLDPSTVYGISKASCELWSNYYHLKYGLDIRSIRYPGVIGYQSMPGGGTTDYAVDIYHKALNNEHFSCYLSKDTRLPMIYMSDAIRATLELMDAPKEHISIRTSYNIHGTTFSPKELFDCIKHSFPDFTISYDPDFRQDIADSWPSSINAGRAISDWGWKPEFDLERITKDMFQHLTALSVKNEC